MKRIVVAHQLHHSEKYGGVPFGMFLGPQVRPPRLLRLRCSPGGGGGAAEERFAHTAACRACCKGHWLRHHHAVQPFAQSCEPAPRPSAPPLPPYRSWRPWVPAPSWTAWLQSLRPARRRSRPPLHLAAEPPSRRRGGRAAAGLLRLGPRSWQAFRARQLAWTSRLGYAPTLLRSQHTGQPPCPPPLPRLGRAAPLPPAPPLPLCHAYARPTRTRALLPRARQAPRVPTPAWQCTFCGRTLEFSCPPSPSHPHSSPLPIRAAYPNAPFTSLSHDPSPMMKWKEPPGPHAPLPPTLAALLPSTPRGGIARRSRAALFLRSTLPLLRLLWLWPAALMGPCPRLKCTLPVDCACTALPVFTPNSTQHCHYTKLPCKPLCTSLHRALATHCLVCKPGGPSA